MRRIKLLKIKSLLCMRAYLSNSFNDQFYFKGSFQIIANVWQISLVDIVVFCQNYLTIIEGVSLKCKNYIEPDTSENFFE